MRKPITKVRQLWTIGAKISVSLAVVTATIAIIKIAWLGM